MVFFETLYKDLYDELYDKFMRVVIICTAVRRWRGVGDVEGRGRVPKRGKKRRGVGPVGACLVRMRLKAALDSLEQPKAAPRNIDQPNFLCYSIHLNLFKFQISQM